MLLGRLVVEHQICTIYHLASILSTKAEYNPETAHRINVEGTLNLLRLAVEQSQWQGKPVKMIYPSSIAAYGFLDPDEKCCTGKVNESQCTNPTTMYGCNKLYCEHLGRYYSAHYRQLAVDAGSAPTVDFRALRFPGLISAETINRWNKRLRSRDAACCARTKLMPVSSDPTHAFPLWSCQMPSKP